ncbi:tail spike protein [Salmonella enterica]|uniref:tail spike protein n=1 Tax=Salmonella enterica TaxID=28901 RepID=UPI0002B60C82|nr:tail spike protein [Salmonella enterica]CCS30265.1 Tail spike protein [Salmonella enterica subsp. enterica serovar Agona str. 40.E.08]
MTFLSDYTTLQQAADATKRDLVIDIDYYFSNNEIVDFNNKVVFVDCQYSFIGDGTLNFKNMGKGSVIYRPCMKSQTTPYVIYRYDSNGAWRASSDVLASVSQSREQGYQPTVNDRDIYSQLPDYIKSQNVYSELLLSSNCSNVTIESPTGEFALIRSEMNNNVIVRNPDILGGKGYTGTIVFVNLDDSSYGHGNKVIGGQVRYGSFSGVTFIRQKGYDGGVQGFKSYRCGESGVKTYQNEINGRSARCYQLTFDNITSEQVYFDGLDANADFGVVSSRIDDYPVSQYPNRQLPTRHRISNIHSIDAKGVGAWWDGQGIVARNITVENSHGCGIWDVGTNNILMNVETIGCNSDNGNYNHITCEGSNQIIGARVTIYGGITGYAVYAPGSQIGDVYTNKGTGSGVILVTQINH